MQLFRNKISTTDDESNIISLFMSLINVEIDAHSLYVCWKKFYNFNQKKIQLIFCWRNLSKKTKNSKDIQVNDIGIWWNKGSKKKVDCIGNRKCRWSLRHFISLKEEIDDENVCTKTKRCYYERLKIKKMNLFHWVQSNVLL